VKEVKNRCTFAKIIKVKVALFVAHSDSPTPLMN